MVRGGFGAVSVEHDDAIDVNDEVEDTDQSFTVLVAAAVWSRRDGDSLLGKEDEDGEESGCVLMIAPFEVDVVVAAVAAAANVAVDDVVGVVGSSCLNIFVNMYKLSVMRRQHSI